MSCPRNGVTCPPERYPQVVSGLIKIKRGNMVKKGYSPEQISNKFREAEILISQGSSIIEAICFTSPAGLTQGLHNAAGRRGGQGVR
jgi:hypothetical protein